MTLLTPQERERINKLCEEAATQLPSPLTPPEKIEINVKYEISPQDLEVLRDIFGQIYEDTFGRYDNPNMWTFAEFKKESNDGNKESN